MSEIIFRKAKIGDLEELIDFRMRFLEEYKGHPRDKETSKLMEVTGHYIEDELPDEGFVAFIAETDGRVIASSGMEVRKVMPRYGPLSNGRMGYIMNMYTLPEFRGIGIGSRLLELLIEEARKLEVGLLHLHASDDGAGIYERAGFADHELPERVMALRS